MAKMTPIETLFNWLGNNHYYIGNDLLEKVEELKEVEKQQIEDAHFNGFIDGLNDLGRIPNKYYNETFNKK